MIVTKDQFTETVDEILNIFLKSSNKYDTRDVLDIMSCAISCLIAKFAQEGHEQDLMEEVFVLMRIRFKRVLEETKAEIKSRADKP